ncbi:hypothetical protein OG978_44670 (plasmid) [Streptomyces sp. NBC_01591]|nr:hypothetical protein [Streptomyces sp. NBC_01591]WSD74207.1 hypothetical protein OG978_44670 [Streptomyces sp. NBC_01591]
MAVLCERYVVSKGATQLAAAGTAGAAFVSLAGLGLLVLDYLVTSSC